jgi:hypothetical protein
MMIELSTYLWTVGSLITIIILFVAHYLREPRIKFSISVLKNELFEIQKKQKETMIINTDLKNKKDIQQKKISEQESKIGLLSKYTFNTTMGYLISRADGKQYCTACLLQFKESPLHKPLHELTCSVCGIKYPLAPFKITFPEK